jgi:hypothetical protein
MSAAEEQLAMQIRALKLPAPEREVCLIEGRKYRWDYAWRPQMLTLEVQGGIWRAKGAHNTGTAILRDCEKACLAAVAGYRQLFVTPEHISDGRAVKWLEEVLGAFA